MLALSDFLKFSCEELSIYFVTEKQSSELHEQFFQDPAPTDCMTFPPGEIVVCPSSAKEYAKKHNADALLETLLYVVHGMLHLAGFDDLDTTARKTMRKMEKKCIAYLDTQGLVA